MAMSRLWGVQVGRGGHDHRVRQFLMSDDGLAVGGPITSYQGVLTGLATHVDD